VAVGPTTRRLRWFPRDLALVSHGSQNYVEHPLLYYQSCAEAEQESRSEED